MALPVSNLRTIITDGTNEAAVSSHNALLTNNFMLAVAMGLIPGMSHINKFGRNAAATSGDDVWDGGGVYAFFPATAQTVQAVSTSTDDDAGGIGALTMQVYGLDDNFDEQNEEVILDGTNPVVLDNTYRRLFRAVIKTAGTAETNVGNISVGVAAGAVGVYIGAGNGQTLQCIYTIPNGKSGYFVKGYVGLVDDDKNGETAQFQWQARPNNGTTGAWAVQGEMGLNNIGSSWWQYEYGIQAGPLPEKTDLRIRVITATATLGTVGGFDLLLVDD
jgi:hypothetical protein